MNQEGGTPHEKALPSLAEMRASVNRDRHVADPISWIRETLDEEPWSKQREILESIRDNRRTAVRSCHSSGKSWVASRIAAWWIMSHEPGEAFVVSTATTESQVKAVLWREIGRVHARGNLPGRTNQTEWHMTMPAGNEEIVALGRKPADINMTAFQGIHAPAVLVIIDEATGVATVLWEALDSLISNEWSKMMVVGNPDDPMSEFCDVCKPGSGWNVIGISAFDTPNLTGEKVSPLVADSLVSPIWVEEKRKKWGEQNPLYISKILGEFPSISTDGLIPMEWIMAAQTRTLEPDDAISILGVDVGGGGNKTTTAHRRGNHVRITRDTQNPDTMQTTGQVIRDIEKLGASHANIDEVGIGKGVVDRARELKAPVFGINVGQSPADIKQYLNLRAEGYWQLRERFQDGEIDIDELDDDLAAQLSDMKFKVTSNGKIQIESKLEMRRRGRDSPDRADAVMMAFLEAKHKKTKATWGRRQH